MRRRTVIIIVREHEGAELQVPPWVRWLVIALVVLALTAVALYRATRS
jgi:hypothetical protein